MNKQTAALLAAHFDTAFAAPDGIRKLRELILTLAMQGKLVPQDPRDPPASQLLKDIEAEKSRLWRDGKIKAPKPLPEITTTEIAYALPPGWEWVRFGNIAQHNSGKTLDKGRNTGQSRKYITTSNLYWGRFELDSVRQMLIREDELEKCTARKNDLLICEGGEAGRAAVWNYETDVCFQNHIHRARLYGDIDPYFAYRFFEKLNATREIEKHRKGVGISNMSSKALASIAFPLPPLPEQHRIVAKIDQLMARCDELERLRAEREQKRRSVHAAALKQLLDAQAADRIADAWQFISQHFGDLYAVKENVTELRKAILQLAVMGKLVPQDPSDPPASQLLKDIEAEKSRLWRNGKIKAPKPLPEIKPAEIPYALPLGWVWSTLAQVALINPRNTAADSAEVSFVPMTLIGTGNDGAHEQEVRAWADVKQGFTHFAEGDIGVAKITPCFENSKACVFSKLKSGLGAGTTELHIVRPVAEMIAPRYVLTYLKSPQFLLVGQTKMTGTAGQKRLPKEFVESNPFPLPPLPEQRRIVAKIDQLMALCDTLEQQINAATNKQTELLDALMAPV